MKRKFEEFYDSIKNNQELNDVWKDTITKLK